MTTHVHSRVSKVAHQLVLLVVAIVLWTIAGLFSPRIFPPIDRIIDAFIQQTVDGPLLDALFFALQSIAMGYIIAVAVGIPIGLLMGTNNIASEFLDPYLDALYFTPFAAVIPAFIMWFGTGTSIRVIVVFSFAIFPIVINTYEGAESIPANYLELANTYNLGRVMRVRYIAIPFSIPYILAGLRLGAGLAVRGLVVTELLVAVTGFGRLITEWSVAFRMEGVISIILVLMALGITFTWLLNQVEKHVVKWDVSHAA